MKKTGIFIGYSTYDIMLSSNDIIKKNEKINGDALWKGTGGCAANAAIAFSQLGGKAVLITSIGNSIIGNIIKEELATYHITVIDASEKEDIEAVMSTIIVSKDGDRTIISTNPNQLNQKDIDSIANYHINADVVLFDRHYMALNKHFVPKYQSIPRILDAGRPTNDTSDLIELANHIIAPNHKAYYQLFKTSTSEKLTAISRGADSILLFNKSITEIAVPKTATVINTSGAGDILHGAYAFALASGLKFNEALEFAAKKATSSVSQWGSRLPQ